MKTKMKTILLATLMFGTLIAKANDAKNSNELEAKRTVKVEFKNVKKGQTLTIKNQNGFSVYNKQIEIAGNYSKLFDFSRLENGIYTAELNKDFEIVIKEFTVKNGLVTFITNRNSKLFKPVIRTKGNILYVSKLTFKEEKINVTIYYKGDEILSEAIKGDDLIKRIYKLSEVKKGDYKVVVNTDSRTYTKQIYL